jgi:hypothetical protein
MFCPQCGFAVQASDHVTAEAPASTPEAEPLISPSEPLLSPNGEFVLEDGSWVPWEEWFDRQTGPVDLKTATEGPGADSARKATNAYGRLEMMVGAMLMSLFMLGPFGWLMGKIFGSHLPEHPGWIMVGLGVALSVLALGGETVLGIALFLALLGCVGLAGTGVVSAIVGHNYYVQQRSSDGGDDGPQTTQEQECAAADIVVNGGLGSRAAQERAYDLLNSDACKYYRAGVP